MYVLRLRNQSVSHECLEGVIYGFSSTDMSLLKWHLSRTWIEKNFATNFIRTISQISLTNDCYRSLIYYQIVSNFFMFFQFSFKITWKEKHVNCMCVFVFNSITVVLFLISCVYGPFPWSVFSSQLSNKRTKDKSDGRHSKNSRPLKDDWFLKTKFGTNLILIYSFHR